MTRFPPNWLQQGTYAASVDRRLIQANAQWNMHPVSPWGGMVTVASGMTVNIAAGQVTVPTANNTGAVLCSWDAQEQVTLAAAPASGSNRIDLIVAQARGNDLDGGANNDFVMQAVTGTAAASPAAPAVPANAAALAQVYVPGGSASVTAGNITDRRWVSQGPGTCLRTAQNATAGNPQANNNEAAISFLVTAALWVPTATQWVNLRAHWRQSTGPGGEANIVRIREGTGITGLELNQFVNNQTPSGAQVGSSPGGSIDHVYQPGVGLKQWVVTLQSTTASIHALSNAVGYPITIAVYDAGDR